MNITKPKKHMKQKTELKKILNNIVVSVTDLFLH